MARIRFQLACVQSSLCDDEGARDIEQRAATLIEKLSRRHERKLAQADVDSFMVLWSK
jgi:hypothetical protein